MTDLVDDLLDDGGEEIPPEPPASPQPVQKSVESLPPDIAEVWGGSPEGAAMAASLVNEWGLDGFRNSAIHIAAIKERQRDGKMEVIRAAFIKAKKEKA